MSLNLIISCVLFAILLPLMSCQCKVESQSYTTSDGIVIARVAHIITFSAKCDNRSPGLSLYADFNDQTLPAIRSSDEQTYQISWTVDLDKASSGSHSIPVYDEEGFTQLRKAQRGGDRAGDTAVKPLFTLDLSHSSPYKGPLLQTELVATLAALGLWWCAYRAKTKLTN